jgi:hypothetical protein
VEALCSSFDLVFQLIVPFMPHLARPKAQTTNLLREPLLIISALFFKEGFHFSQNTEVMPDVSDEDKHSWNDIYNLKNCCTASCSSVLEDTASFVLTFGSACALSEAFPGRLDGFSLWTALATAAVYLATNSPSCSYPSLFALAS